MARIEPIQHDLGGQRIPERSGEEVNGQIKDSDESKIETFEHLNKNLDLSKPVYVSNDKWDFEITKFGLSVRRTGSEDDYRHVDLNEWDLDQWNSLPREVKIFLSRQAQAKLND